MGRDRWLLLVGSLAFVASFEACGGGRCLNPQPEPPECRDYNPQPEPPVLQPPGGGYVRPVRPKDAGTPDAGGAVGAPADPGVGAIPPSEAGSAGSEGADAAEDGGSAAANSD